MLISLCSLGSRHLTSFTLLSKPAELSFKRYTHAKLLLNMNEAFFHYEEGNERFEVSLRYVNPAIKFDRQFNFHRSVNEPIKSFLNRMEANISTYMIKKMRRKSKAELWSDMADNVKKNTIKFVRNDCELDGDISCRSILENPSNIKLIVFDTEYVLRKNAPRILKIELPSCILVDFPVYPVKFESLYTNIEKSTFTWYKREKENWVMIGVGYFYVPHLFDLGFKLKIVCTPKSDEESGPSMEIEAKNKVEAGPGNCPFEIRHVFTKNKLSNKSFRVVSYNILANTYSETELSKDVLYPYCPEYALSIEYRKLLILQELQGYNADIICLQEVDTKVYKNDLVPFLQTSNYSGIFNLKNDLMEGLAIFYNQERFDKLSSNFSVIGQNTDFPGFNDTWSQIQNKNVQQAFKNRNTIVQTIILKSKENSEILIVGNTHLFFKPDADHIRLLQAYYGLMYLQSLANETREKNPECNVSIMFCGDFNSVPENGVYQLMTQKYIPEDYADWKSTFNEHVENVSLRHDRNMLSACGTPKYTNYTATFAACLDYIFYEKDHLEVEQVIPMPSEEELSLHTGLPSVVFPSDHIALCADLKWLNKTID